MAFPLLRVNTCKEFYQNARYWKRTCQLQGHRIYCLKASTWALFSPEILQAGTVKGLNTRTNQPYCKTSHMFYLLYSHSNTNLYNWSLDDIGPVSEPYNKPWCKSVCWRFKDQRRKREREIGRQTGTDTDIQQRQTDRHWDRQTLRQTDRQAGRQADRQTGMQTETERRGK